MPSWQPDPTRVYQTDIREFSGLKCRIQVRCQGGRGGIWQQRHIWWPSPAYPITEVRADPWIRTFTQNGALAVSGKTPTAAPDADLERRDQ